MANLNKKRSVVNKFTDNLNDITVDKFYSGHGEFIISIEAGKEGIFVKNTDNEVVELGTKRETIEEIIIEKLKEIVPVVGNSSLQALTKEQYDILVENNLENPNVYYMIYEDEENNNDPDFSIDNIILTEDYNPSETIVIEEGEKKLFLNNKKISAPLFIDESDNSTNSYGLWVKGGEVTIEDNGEIVAQDANYSMAVWANGGTVIIKDGVFRNAGQSCDLIYASNGGKVYIYGGDFYATPKGSEPGTGNDFSALNIKNSDINICEIKVYGGRFYKFNPADNLSEGPGTNFVAEGYKSEQEGDFWVVKPK